MSTNGDSNPAQSAADPSSLPDETLAFAARMFDAARTGDPDGILIAAIDAGLPVNLTNHQGNTLLMLCTYTSPTTHTLPLTQALLSRGADPNRLNDAGQSILAGVVFKRSAEVGVRDEIVRLLIAKGADPRIGKPNAVECTWMFVKEKEKDEEGGGMWRDELLGLFGATEEDRERLEREGVRVRVGLPGV